MSIKGKLVLSFYDDETPTKQLGAGSFVFDLRENNGSTIEKSMSNVIEEIMNTLGYLQNATSEITLFPENTKQSVVSERLHDCFCLIPMITERTKRMLDKHGNYKNIS